MGSSCSHLGIPAPKGPNIVGCTDFMMDHSTRGSFFRLYYPCQKTEKAEKPDWVPSREYFNGLADFMKINRSLGEKLFSYFFGSFKIPAYTDAPFKSSEKCPVVIFSHGLGAFRTLYSAICAELASQGFIVASVEHRDQSASATYYFREKAESERSASAQDGLTEEWMYYRALRHGESEFPLRNQQVKQRADECILALDRLTDINSGVAVQNVLQTQFDWTTLENSMDLCRTAVMGHSFGGATAVEALCKEVKFKCGVALDSWMFPLDDEIFPRVKQPIFFINSEKFQWAGNISRMRKLDSAVVQRKMITIRGTVHQSFPDFTFMTSNWIGKLMKLKGEIDPELAIDLSNKASLAFLQRHLGLEKNFNQWYPLIDGEDENLIQGTNIPLLQSAM
ncbi:platelet-activating factor acetylhydrolase [Kryptolebias marmoratus]|uniref:Platelet-activating factor acetylhydrolase n=1 Tax=Kryptolebias marmoratus TaxID=37003 RepID=A0A3Q2ZQ07_KRYMA|nr:platelet-activating factor acetylhydrolase [Kryptolebias marmoratus]